MPMLLKSDDGKEFELAIIEEPLSDPQDGFGDSSFATVSFRVATTDEEWEETAPSFNTYELGNLAEWLEAVAGAGGDEAEIDLLEPELNFQVVKDEGDRVTIRVRFSLEDRPEEMGVDAPTTEARAIDIRVSRKTVGAAAAELKSDLSGLREQRKDDLNGERDEGVRPAMPEIGIAGRDVAEIPGSSGPLSETVAEDDSRG